MSQQSTALVILLFIIAAFFTFGVYSIAFPLKVEKSYSLEWLPADTLKDVNQFQVNTVREEIKYYYVDRKIPGFQSVTHSLEVENSVWYDANKVLIIDETLLIGLTLSGFWLVVIVSLGTFAVISGLAGIFVLCESRHLGI